MKYFMTSQLMEVTQVSYHLSILMNQQLNTKSIVILEDLEIAILKNAFGKFVLP